MSSTSTSRMLEIDGRRILLTHLDEMLWPEAGVSKGDLLDYYLEIADVLLPYLARRPVSLLKAADPITGECPYQRTAPPGLPSWIMTRRLPTEHVGQGSAEFVLGADRATIAYVVNLGYLSFHPWGCTADTLDRPDQLLFDLDPCEIAFREVRNAALLVRDLLARFRIRASVKTTGGRGLHVMVPLQPLYSFEQVRTAAATLTRMARAREPRLFTLDMRRARRRGKILIDVHRNHRGATLVSPYSVREYEQATVSTPLEWHELERPLYPEEFTIKTVRERLATVGDPLAASFAQPQLLAGLLEGPRARRARQIA